MIIRLELLRVWRSRRPLLTGFSLLFFLMLMLLGFYTYARTETGGDVDFRYTYENESYFNGLTFALYAFYFGFLLILPIFAATEGGAQIAGDTASRTLNLYLSRPLTRSRIFFTKFTIAACGAALVVGFFLAISLALGLFTVGWGDLRIYPGVLQMTSRPQALSQDEALFRFFLAWPTATLALLTPLSLSFLLSSWAKSPINAVGISFALYLMLYVIAEIHFFRELRPWLFTSSMSYWRGLFQEEIPWKTMGQEAAKLCGFTALFLALAFRRFRTREER